VDTQNFDKFEEQEGVGDVEASEDNTAFIGYTFKREEPEPELSNDFFSDPDP
jgi:hypothetical protein